MGNKVKDIAALQKDAQRIFYKGVEAVEPGAAIRRYCRRDGRHFFVGDRKFDLAGVKNIFVVGAGKASAPMAAAIEDLLEDNITAGIVNVKYGYTAKLGRIKLVEAGHPVPDSNGQKGAAAILNLV